MESKRSTDLLNFKAILLAAPQYTITRMDATPVGDHPVGERPSLGVRSSSGPGCEPPLLMSSSTKDDHLLKQDELELVAIGLPTTRLPRSKHS